MPGVSRKDVDTAGGAITGGSGNTFINGSGCARIGDSVAPHPSGFPHQVAVMASGSSKVFCNGISVCRQGDSASCGHTASGSSNTFAG